MTINVEGKNNSIHTKLTFLFLVFLIFILNSPGFAFELLTFESTNLQYTYYLNAAGETIKHGTQTQWYTYPGRAVSQIVQYSHGKKHGLDEAWYVPGTNGYVKHWEKNYQNGKLHGLSKEWSSIAGVVQAITNYRYGVLHGPYQRWRNTRDYYHKIEDANYTDGLLDGPYTKWIVRSYTYYGYTYRNQQIKDQEGSYAYGKKDGYWKYYQSSAAYPYYLLKEGAYGNDAECGDWKYYNIIGNVSSTQSFGICQGSYPAGGGGDFPSGKKFEIRGQVFNNDTSEPLAGAIVQAWDGSSTTDETGFYTIVLDSGNVYTLNCSLDTYYDYSKTVDMTIAQYVTVDIGMKPKEPGDKPGITNVDSVKGNFFIETLSADNDYVVSVDWNGEGPGTVKFDVNGTEFEVAGDQTGATYRLDMGADFKGSLSPTGNILKITAINDSGVASDVETLNPIVIPLPDWSINFDNGFEIKTENNNLVYKLALDWPEKPIEILVDENELGSILWQAWGLFPYIGGRVFGIPGSQAFFELEAKTDGTGSIAAGGKSGFKAAGGDIEIKLGAKGNLKYEADKGLGWKETSLIVGVAGSISKEVGPVTIIPALEGAVNLPVIGRGVAWFNDRAKIKGTISTGSEMALEIMSATGDIGFNKADVETNAGLKLGMSLDIIEDLKAEITGGGTGKLLWQVPADPDYFKQLQAELAADITFTIMGWQWTTGYTHPFAYPETTVRALSYTQSIPSYTMRPVSRGFLNLGTYNRPVYFSTRSIQDIGGIGPKSDYQIIENVFPYSDPAIAEYSGNTAIAYVYLDPDDLPNQDTEIYYSFFDGTDYTSPAPIFNDTRADFSPSIAYDSAGKIICVWQRVKTEDFQGSSIVEMVPELEIVYSVFDPAADDPAWSVPLALTDNTFMDYNPMLQRGDDGSLMLVWLSNDGNQLIGDSNASTRIHYAQWNGSQFSTGNTVAESLENSFKFSFAYNGTSGILTYTKDMDGIFTAPEGADTPGASDQEIFYIEFNGSEWGLQRQVTDDNIADTASRIVYTSTGPELVWLRGDTLVRKTSESHVYEIIKTNIISAGLTDFKLYSDPSDHLVLLWQESDDKGIDLFYSVYDNDNSIWSNDLRLTNDPDMEKDFSGLFDENGTLHLVFNKKDTDTQATGLFHMTYALDVDLELPLDSIRMDISSPLPGDEITLTAKVVNRGDLSVIDSSISFYLGHPAPEGLMGTAAIVPASLKAGETGQATLKWTIPTDISEYTVYAVVDPEDTTMESDETNNMAQFEIIKPDLEAVHCYLDKKADGSYHVVAVIKNHGMLDATDVDVMFKAEEDVIGTMVIPSILAGLTAQVSFPASLEYYRYSSWEPRISFLADADNKIFETNEENNTASTIYTLELLSPSTCNFQNVPYNGAIQTIVIFNKTQIEMAIGDITLAGQDAGDFVLADAPCENGIIPAQSSCVVGVECLPSSSGIKKAELIINNNLGSLLGSVSLTGELDHLIPGDVNDSKSLDIVDVMTALKLATGLSEAQIYLIVDTDKDGRISINEAIFVLQKNAAIRP